ncbi:MAG: hypothetical protein RXO24_12295 [Acidilobus sp.]
MASCQPRVPEIKYCDESWWQEFFTKDLAEFYASLEGLLSARDALINELSGDLAQVLADPRRRDLALRVLFGGLDENCLEKIRRYRPSYYSSGYIDCIKGGTAAHFYRGVLEITLGEQGYKEDAEKRKELLNLLKTMSLEELGKEKLGVSIKGNSYSMMKNLSEMKGIVKVIYSKIKQAIQIQQAQADYGLDLVKAFEDFLNKSIKLLPLYNPFTFFIESLYSTPRPYLSIMYGEELFSDPVRNLMSKYGVELTKILDPGLNVQSKNDELAVVGHKDGSVGKLIDKLVWKIYIITSELSGYDYSSVSDELKKYLGAKYNEVTSAGYTIERLVNTIADSESEYEEYCNGRYIKVKNGTIESYGETLMPYDRFLELFSPLLFLGIAWIEGNSLYLVCPYQGRLPIQSPIRSRAGW